MRKTILIALTFAALMFIIAFAADNSSKRGIYSVTPSFKAEVDYDLNEYKAISDNISKIIWTCTNKKTDCLTESVKGIAAFDFYFKNRGNIITLKDAKSWNIYCEAHDEDFFYDFVEFYSDCINSLGNVCKCEMNLSRYGSITEINSIKSPDVSDVITMILPSKEIEEDIYLNGFQADALKISPKGKKLVLVKNSTNKKLYFDEKTAVAENCKVSNKIFKACVVSKKTFLAQNQLTKSIGEQNIVTRFAFRMLDLPPPPLKNVQAFDKKKASNKMVIRWNESEAIDISKYAIYYSTTDFNDVSLPDCVSSGICKKVELDADSTVVNSIDLEAEPIFDKALGVYVYGYEENKLYHLKSDTKNYYFYSIEVPENKNYFIAVTGIDVAGNELDNLKQGRLTYNQNYVEAESVDDIPTGKVSDITIDSTNQLSWTEPKENIDGTILDINSRIDYQIYEFADSEFFKIGDLLGEPPYPVDPAKTYKVLAIKRSAPVEEPSLEWDYLMK